MDKNYTQSHHQGQNAVGQVDLNEQSGQSGAKKHQTDPEEGFGAYLPWVDPMILSSGVQKIQGDSVQSVQPAPDQRGGGCEPEPCE